MRFPRPSVVFVSLAWLAIPFGSCRAETPLDTTLARGHAVYQTRCMRCHAISTNEVGPRHQNVVGRQAGAVPDFVYSAALKNSKVVWTAENLDHWLKDPEAFIPGQEMDVRLRSAEERRLVIAYLASQSAPAAVTRAASAR
ncbi:MAG: c-type cytochrome [Rubrivivax sp.]|nr:MAG: c-type cytochrome [Rubrivivax sp.]